MATDTTRPSIPTGLAVTSATCKQIELSWNPSTDSGGSGLSRYEVYRNNGYLTSVQSPFVGVVDASVAASSTYLYEVEARDNAGNPSGRSAARTANTPACATSAGALRFVSKVAAFAGAAPAAVKIAVDEVRGLAYATSFYGGVKVLDVTNDATPRVLGSIDLPDGEADLALLPGNRAYVTQTDRLVLLDLSVPSNPRVASNVYLPVAGTPLQVLVDGSRAYVSAAGQLLVLDVTAPSAPRLLAAVPLPSLAGSLAFSGGYVYAASSKSTDVIDVRNPSAPTTTHLLGSRSAIGNVVHDGYLYWHGVSGGGGSLLVFDVSRLPQYSVALNALYPASALVLADHFAYTAPPSTAEVWELDMTTLLGRGGIPTAQLPPPKTRISLGADVYALATGKAGSVIYAIDASGAFNVIAR